MATIASNVAQALTLDQQILALCQQIAVAQKTQEDQMLALTRENAALAAQVAQLLAGQLALATAPQVSAVQATVDAIQKDVESENGPAVGFVITIQGDDFMAKVKTVGVDFVLHDDGSAAATLTPVDAAGVDTTMPAGAGVPVWTSSSPAVVVTAAADGLSAHLTPSAPAQLATGVIITATSTLADGATLSGSGDPIDVVGGTAVGFKIAEQ
jgi:hypothetical protein